MRAMAEQWRWPWRRRYVAGLDVSGDTLGCVILSGNAHRIDAVCSVQRLTLAPGWVVDGVVQLPEHVGAWLRDQVRAMGCRVDRWCLAVADAQVHCFTATLPAHLSAEDVMFQLQAEVQQAFATAGQTFVIDYERAARSLSDSPAVFDYSACAVDQAHVAALQHMARVARVALWHIEPRRDASARVDTLSLDTLAPSVDFRRALTERVALGLALADWTHPSFNLLPQRLRGPRVRQRTRWVAALVCALGGAVLAAGFALVMSTQARYTVGALPAVDTLTQTLQASRQAQAQSKKRQQQHQASQAWWKSRLATQAQSQQWAQALSQLPEGLWIAQVQQRGVRWSVQGEAWSAEQAQQLQASLAHLKIWTHPPRLEQLQRQVSAMAGAMPVWQFRIEAELVAGG